MDDDDAIIASLELLLRRAGHAPLVATSPDAALDLIAKEDPALVLQDMNFSRQTSGEEGLALLARIRAARPDIPVVLMTAWGSIDLAVQGMRGGARDFVTKPWSNEQILHVVDTTLDVARTETQAGSTSREGLAAAYDLTGVVGQSAPFLAAVSVAAKVARTDATVLITGESGTGKEILARFVHANSHRAAGPFVPVNLGGVPSTLFDSELFGHVKGAFTDARRTREGRIAAARGGTLFLDEVGEMDAACQVKMLRVLQERTYEPLGTNETQRVEARLVSATNRDLEADIREGRFREDLFYRLNLITVKLPTLAERRGDVPLLAHHFVGEVARTYGRPELRLAEEATTWLSTRSWPGNVRQLRHVIERTSLMAEHDELSARDFESALELFGERHRGDWVPPVGSVSLEEMEKAMILRAIEHHGGNVTHVADSLGISRQALYRRLERFGIRV